MAELQGWAGGCRLYDKYDMFVERMCGKMLRKVFVVVLCIVLLVVALAGCMHVNVGIEVEENGEAELEYKVLIEESAYFALNSFGDSGRALDGGAGPGAGSVDFEEFVKEKVDDEVFYVYEETVEAASYDALEEVLVALGDDDGVDLFSGAEIYRKNDRYFFEVSTTVLDDGGLSLRDDNWLMVDLLVTLPGEIEETNGEIVERDGVRFVVDDFTEEQVLQVESEEDRAFPWLAVIGLFFVGCLVVYWRRRGTMQRKTLR